MQYDPIKNIFNSIINKSTLFRQLFFLLLDILILRQWYVKKQIKQILKNKHNSVFYDAGAGFCQYSDFVLNNFPQTTVIATDLKNDYLNDFYSYLKPAQKKKFSYTTADLQKYISPQKVDLIIAVDILEHIEDDISTLKNFYNSMNNNAHLLISTPSNQDKAAAFTEEHVRPGYSIEEITAKLRNQGFKICSQKYSYGFFGKIYWNLIMKSSLKISSISKFLVILLPFYLLIVLLPALLCMYLDFKITNNKGNGLIILAQK